MKKNILFLFNAVEASEKVGIYGECATFTQVGAIYNAILKSGNNVEPLNVLTPQQLSNTLSQGNYDIAFVIAEGYLDIPETLYDGSGSQLIRQVLKTYNIPYSHSSIECMESCRNKDYTYQILKEKGILVPSYYVVNPEQDLAQQFDDIDSNMEYPLFVKPTGGGNSIGIDESSIVYNFQQLDDKITSLITQLGSINILVETYLSGREYTIGILGDENPYVLPIIGFPLTYKVRSFNSKKLEQNQRQLFNIVDCDDPRYLQIQDLAIKTFKAVGANDIIRLEVREDCNKNLYVIDVNGTPAITQGGSLSYMMEQLDLEHYQLICSILYFALKKNNISINKQLQIIMDDIFLSLTCYKQVINTSQQVI